MKGRADNGVDRNLLGARFDVVETTRTVCCASSEIVLSPLIGKRR